MWRADRWCVLRIMRNGIFECFIVGLFYCYIVILLLIVFCEAKKLLQNNSTIKPITPHKNRRSNLYTNCNIFVVICALRLLGVD